MYFFVICMQFSVDKALAACCKVVFMCKNFYQHGIEHHVLTFVHPFNVQNHVLSCNNCAGLNTRAALNNRVQTSLAGFSIVFWNTT